MAGQARIRLLDGLQGACREPGPFRRKQLGQHGVARERVAKAERVLIHRHDLRVDRGVERGHDRTLVESRDRRQEVPVEATAEDGRRRQHGPCLVAQRDQPSPHAVDEGHRHDVVDGAGQRPRRAAVDERARRDRHRQQLLDEEGHPVGARRQGHQLGRRLVGPETGLEHLRHVDVVETAQFDQVRRAPGMQRPGQVEAR